MSSSRPARDVPDPPPITEADRRRILEEARLWREGVRESFDALEDIRREGVRESFDALEDITPEDWRTVVR